MGMRIRRIQTTTKKVGGKDVVVPALDGNGKEIELWSVDVPREIEALGGIPAEVEREGKLAIEDYIAAKLLELQQQADAEVPADETSAETESEEG